MLFIKKNMFIYSVVFVMVCFLPSSRKFCIASRTSPEFPNQLLENEINSSEMKRNDDSAFDGSGSFEKKPDQNEMFTYNYPENSSFTTATMNDVYDRIMNKPSVNSAINAILVLVVIQTMLGLGCTMDITLIKEHLYNPTSMGIAAACQFGIMPFIAFLMAKIFQLNKIAALAVLVTGSCPGGNLSNLLTYFFYGDMNLSILMSTSSTILALVCMPLCLFIYGSGWIDVSTIGRMIPFGGVVLSLILTLIPVGIGIAIKTKFEKIANTILKISLFSLFVSFIALMTLSIILFGTSLFYAISGASYAIAIIMPFIGYGSGYLLATGFGLTEASRRTVAIETGCQNSQLSSTILKMAFASQTMGAYFLFPIYYALFQGLEGLALIIAFRVYRRYTADERLAPTSRVTYDQFANDFDGEDKFDGFESHYNSSSPGSGDSLYRVGNENYTKDGTLAGPISSQNHGSAGGRNKTKVQRNGTFGDKTSLIPQGSSLSSPGIGNYGGINE